MTFPSEAFTWATLKAEIKARLRVPGTAEDERLEDWFDAIIFAADVYIGDVKDSAGNDVVLTDSEYRSVKAGIIEYLRKSRDAGELLPLPPSSVLLSWRKHKITYVRPLPEVT